MEGKSQKIGPQQTLIDAISGFMTDCLRLIDVNAGGFRLKKGQGILHPILPLTMLVPHFPSLISRSLKLRPWTRPKKGNFRRFRTTFSMNVAERFIASLFLQCEWCPFHAYTGGPCTGVQLWWAVRLRLECLNSSEVVALSLSLHISLLTSLSLFPFAGFLSSLIWLSPFLCLCLLQSQSPNSGHSKPKTSFEAKMAWGKFSLAGESHKFSLVPLRHKNSFFPKPSFPGKQSLPRERESYSQGKIIPRRENFPSEGKFAQFMLEEILTQKMS